MEDHYDKPLEGKLQPVDNRYDRPLEGDLQPLEPQQKSTVLPWILAILGILYLISPVDIIPDVPVVGWLDDLFIAGTGILNLLQRYAENAKSSFAPILKTLKWIGVIVSVVVVVVLGLIVFLVVKLVS